jgi:hypothetical protein
MSGRVNRAILAGENATYKAREKSLSFVAEKPSAEGKPPQSASRQLKSNVRTQIMRGPKTGGVREPFLHWSAETQ